MKWKSFKMGCVDLSNSKISIHRINDFKIFCTRIVCIIFIQICLDISMNTIHFKAFQKAHSNNAI